MQEHTLRYRMKKHRWNYLFVSPMIVMYIIFTLIPLINIVRYSFYKWDGYGPLLNYVGLDNYTSTITDPYYWNAFKNALIFAMSHLFFEVIIALLLAVVLNNLQSRMRNIYRLLIFIPVVTTTAVAGLIFTILLDPLGGTINEMLMNLNLISRPINFLGSTDNALPVVIAVSIWKRVGISLVYWLAALQTIPPDLYESADIDGASGFQKFIHITVPMLVPIGSVIALFAFKNGLFPFDLVKTMTGGGPIFSTDVVDTYIFRYAFNSEFSSPKYGFASAAGTVFAVSVIVITLLMTYLLRRKKAEKK